MSYFFPNLLNLSWRTKVSHPKTHSKDMISFHTSSPKAQNGNDTSIHIVIGNLLIPKFLFRVVGQNS